MKKLVKVVQLNLKKEDGGMALVSEGVCYDINKKESDPDPNVGVFFRVISWDEGKTHEEIQPFIGKKVKITMEITD
jgi:hypothetical protein